MKNIHILPTDKPSRLFDDGIEFYLGELKDRKGHPVTSYNIYITSDEEIKEGDWFVNFDLLGRLDTIYDPIHKCLKVNNSTITSFEAQVEDEFTILKSFCKKIILTDNPDLIKDGVQAIDDEFLEWFVNNPSCEFVKTSLEKEYGEYETGGGLSVFRGYEMQYKITIPKEEQLYAWVGAFDEMVNNYIPCQYELKDIYQGDGCLPNFKTKEECQYWCNNYSPYSIPKEGPKGINAHTGFDDDGNSLNYQGNMLPLKEESKQETLEDVVVKRINDNVLLELHHSTCYSFAEIGAKWQQENILELLKSNGYDDEPIFDLINNYLKS